MKTYVQASFPLAVAIVSFFYSGRQIEDKQEESYIEGEVDPDFQHVAQAFISNFNEGWEPEGASFTVYHNGRKVVDLWGGYADKEAERRWEKDTISITFSTTKSVAALCVALLVDRGLLRYDDFISQYWPEFGRHGKENITVQMALSHMGGLAYFDQTITPEVAKDHKLMKRLIENESPKWEPGTKNGYHAYTIGWIVDQLVRHVDEKNRGIGQFFKEEIAEPHDIDYHIGLPKHEAYRVARVSVASIWQILSEVYHDFRVVVYFKSIWKLMTDTPLARSASNPSWLKAVGKCTMNNPEYYQLEQPAALGIGNSRSLATLFNLVVTGQLLGSQTLNQIQKFHTNEKDFIFDDVVAKGHGFFYLPVDRAGTPYVIGHTGHGCQQIIFDTNNKLVISYVSNGLKMGIYGLCRTYMRLQNSVYDVIENNSTLIY